MIDELMTELDKTNELINKGKDILQTLLKQRRLTEETIKEAELNKYMGKYYKREIKHDVSPVISYKWNQFIKVLNSKNKEIWVLLIEETSQNFIYIRKTPVLERFFNDCTEITEEEFNLNYLKIAKNLA